MKTINAMLTMSAILVLSACGNSNNQAPTADSGTDFNRFVISTFAKTADDTDPIDVNGLDFRFADQEDPAAFDSQL